MTGKTYNAADAQGTSGVVHKPTDMPVASEAAATVIQNAELEQGIGKRTKSLKQENQALISLNSKLEEKGREAQRTQEIAHLGSWELELESGRLTWSDEVYRIFGLLPQEFPATYENFLGLVHPEDRESVDRAYSNSVLVSLRGYDIEHRIIRPRTGEVRYVHEKCEHVRDAAGNVVRSVGMVHDITEHKLTSAKLRDLAALLEQKNSALEEANEELVVSNNELEQRRHEAEKNQKKLQQLSSAVENSPVSIIITNKHGLIEYVNPKFTEVSGYLPEEVIGQNPRILKASGHSDEGVYRALWTTISAGREWRGDLCNRKKNGDIHWEHASISPISDENGIITHFVAFKEDVTEQRHIARELMIAHELADAANRSKSVFLANMSHEIRTPLNAIIGFSSLALKGELPPLQQDYIRKIHSAGESLLNIVGDILDFSKVEAGQLQMEHIPFRLEALIDDAFSLIQQKARAKRLDLTLEVLPETAAYLVGDPHRLSQIIVNLMSNAVKFTEQGAVALEVSLLTQEHDRMQLQFCVRDTGIGISAEQLSTLFKPFIQADGSTTRRFGGTGLGPFISKQLAELMGGKIWCESTPGDGSSFCFTAWFGVCREDDFTRSAVSCATPAENASLSFDFSGRRVLLVEDNEINRQLALELLKDTGAEVYVAENGKAAVMNIFDGDNLYDLVLMDVQMPVMDGYEATRLIRSESRFSSLPIIAMTAHAMLEEQQKVVQAGMNAHISKPIHAQTMLETMKYFLCEQETKIDHDEQFPDTGCSEAAVPAIADLDTSEALERLAGNLELYLWVLRKFVEKDASSADLIEEALKTGNTEQALRCAHTIRTTAGTMGANCLAECALALEIAITLQKSEEQIGQAVEQFRVELCRLVSELRKHLPAGMGDVQSFADTAQCGPPGMDVAEKDSVSAAAGP